MQMCEGTMNVRGSTGARVILPEFWAHVTFAHTFTFRFFLTSFSTMFFILFESFLRFSNSIKISIFFGIIATVYIGLTHLFINISNYSYLILFVSFVTNSILSFILSVIRVYRPIFFRNRRL